MRRHLGTGIFAASVLAAALAWPVSANARDTAMTVAATSATARAQLATPKAKRVRKQTLRRVAAVAAPASHHSQCFFFWCNSGGRTYSFLMLGIGY